MQKATHAERTDARATAQAMSAEEVIEQYDALIGSVVRWSQWHFNHQTQEDVSQKIRAKLLTAIPKFRGEASLDFYVKRICVNQCATMVRKQQKDQERFVPTVTKGESGEWSEMDFTDCARLDPVRTVILAERGAMLRRLVDAMDALCRDALTRFYLEGASYKEIAEKCRISINTVGSRLAKCIRKLRTSIENDPHLRDDFRPSLD